VSEEVLYHADEVDHENYWYKLMVVDDPYTVVWNLDKEKAKFQKSTLFGYKTAVFLIPVGWEPEYHSTSHLLKIVSCPSHCGSIWSQPFISQSSRGAGGMHQCPSTACGISRIAQALVKRCVIDSI
jgi:hypothetical protein